jgi:hypothetical protein
MNGIEPRPVSAQASTHDNFELLNGVNDDRCPCQHVQEPNRIIHDRQPARLSVLHELNVESKDDGI